MRFLVDAQLPPALARWLTQKGYPAEHVVDIQMESATDSDIWSYAERNGTVVVTKDDDFARLAVARPGNARVVWLRVGNSTRRELLAWMERAWATAVMALDADEQVIEVISLGDAP